MKIRILLFIFSLTFTGFVFSQTKEDVEKITKNYDLEKIKELEVSLKKKEASEKKAAYEAAKVNGWPIIIQGENGSFQELIKLTPDGLPIYYSNDNTRAARSTRTNFLNTGGALGLNLDGQNMVARVWDGGTVRRTHSGFGGRVTTVDDASGAVFSQHATHVSGTVIANIWSDGPTGVKGMAPQATARTFNWTNDESESLSEVALGMLISNHSYGVPIGSGTSALPAWYIGSYVEDSRVWDEITYLSPYYLPVYSAGNDGNNNNNSSPIAYGYDKLVGNKVAKNVLTIANANDASIAFSTGALVSVSINSFSSQGPTDDRRIKPDITGNGTGVTSLSNGSNFETATLDGTSMAAPNVSGTLLLLQQYYKNLTNGFMRSATLKGLACHTADDAGVVGPDPVFGWGLLNAKKAAETLTNNGLTSWVSEERLNQGQSYTMTVKSNGETNNPLIASITWTDLPGEANNGQRLTPNDPFKSLVNDLDIRITKDGDTFYPWRLDVNSPTSPALRDGDNNVDNVEIIKIDTPVAGDYVITITHKGNLVTGGQNYSLVVTGIASDFALTSKSDDLIVCSNQDAVYTFDYKQIGTMTTTFSAVGLPIGATANFSPTSLSDNGTVTMTISGLASVQPGTYSVGISGSNGMEVETRLKQLRVYSATFQPSVLITPTNGQNSVASTAFLNWNADVNVETYNLQVSAQSDFSSLFTDTNTTETTYLITGLIPETTYYWRVVPSNRCGVASASDAIINNFRTGVVTCGNTFTATDFSNATIASTANSIATVPIVVNGGLTIGDINVNLNISHTYIQDMKYYLEGPAAIGSPIIILFEEPCGNNDDIDCTLDDAGVNFTCGATLPSITGVVKPKGYLTDLNNLPADGTWILRVVDAYNGDGGVINSVSMSICNIEQSLSSGDNILNVLKVYPNPAKGIVNIDLAGNVTGETTYELFDVQGRKVVSKVSSNTIETLNVETLSDGIYMLSIQNGSAKTTKKVIINK